MPDDRPDASTLSLDAWLERVHDALGPSAGAALTSDEQAALLDIARVAAHGSERIAAPLTTFLAGVAYGTRPAPERGAALSSLAETLEQQGS